jgi:hypothetical protein
VEQVDLRDVFKKASKRVCTSAVVVSHDPLSRTPSTSVVKSAANIEVDPDDHEPTDGGAIWVEYLLD